MRFMIRLMAMMVAGLAALGAVLQVASRDPLGTPLLAFAQYFPGQTSSLYFTWPGNDHPLPVTPGRNMAIAPLWSPDGRWVLYQGGVGVIHDLYTLRVDLTERHNISDHPILDYHPAWSPDGEWVAFVSERDGNPNLYLVRPDGSDLHRLTDHPGSDDNPAWSPDGAWIAFVSLRGPEHKIYLVRPDGSDLHPLTETPYLEYAPVWSPDGDWIAFVSLTEFDWNLFTARADGSDLRPLANSERLESEPAWSPDGAWVAYFRQEYAGRANRTFVASADGALNVPVPIELAYVLHPSWSPDGTRLAVEAGTQWDGAIFTFTPPDGPLYLLTAGLPDHARDPAWSPDGDWIAFQVCDDPFVPYNPRYGRTYRCLHHIDVYAVHPDGTGLRNLTDQPGLNQDLAWSPATEPVPLPRPLGRLAVGAGALALAFAPEWVRALNKIAAHVKNSRRRPV